MAEETMNRKQRRAGGKPSAPPLQTVKPSLLPLLLNQAFTDHRAGRLAEAERLYRRILAEYPDQPETLHHLGLIAQAAKDWGCALALITRSLALKPAQAEAYNNLATVFLYRSPIGE
ncbi:hypothetical protein WCLP8_680005 [uncultured Gammaproteobacteria bacterium]